MNKAVKMLRYKSYAFSSPVEKEVLLASHFIEKTVKAYRQLHKVNAFLNEANS